MNRIVHWVKDAVRVRSLSHSLRSPQWPSVERAFIELNGVCAACGCNQHLQVHHKKPFHLFPELELVPSNLITLCENKASGNHHLMIGHGGNWKSFNENVVEDAAILKRSLGDPYGTNRFE